ncbi:DarT ssDNA thymidine ADP-ribosyltransferase family protein [Limnoraphis robusta]|uniref:DarT ssDNA thymidine ADP-ribosyltransferase family protein n=1 Tax=Limnospira sp. TaxID=3100384 RepID=UPI003F71ECF7|nr:DarT ssDNA thymidine ADP-ribosyltransferase family protein [Limnoraphis robusta]
MVQVGKIKWFGGFNAKRGVENNYGFIERQGEPDLYVHRSQVKCECSNLVEGKLVKFGLGFHNHREQAKNLELLKLSEETDPNVLEACFEHQDPEIWQPIINQYLSTVSADKITGKVIKKINSLNHKQQLILIELLSPELLFSPELRSFRDSLPTDKHLQLCQKILPADVNAQISEELREEIIYIFDSASHTIDLELAESIRHFIPDHPYLKKQLAREYLNKLGIKYLYHMTHVANLNSILKNGLLSHNQSHEGGFIQTDISMEEAQEWRKEWHGYVPFYFNPRNTMLYKRRELQNQIVMLAIDPMLILEEGTWFSDGNVAAVATNVYNDIAMLEQLPWEIIKASSWNYEDLARKQRCKRIMCAEMLVPNRVNVQSILKIFCSSQLQISTVRQLIPDGVNISVEVKSSLYF